MFIVPGEQATHRDTGECMTVRDVSDNVLTLATADKTERWSLRGFRQKFRFGPPSYATLTDPVSIRRRKIVHQLGIMSSRADKAKPASAVFPPSNE